MAGSYGQCCNDDGSFRFDLIENLGDAHEACEDMHRRIADLEAKLAEERMIATKQANRLEEMDAELLYAEAKLADAQADSDGNYTQGIQRGRIIALRAINSMPEPYGINKMDRAVHYTIRADCIEAINNAIAATREESE